MRYIKEWSEYNPILIKSVKDFVETNKYNLPHLWDNNLTEDENVEFLVKYFTNYPNEMNSILNSDKIKKATRTSSVSLKDRSPIFQNIGGVHDFKSF